MEKITSNLPMNTIDASEFIHLQNLELADPNYSTPGNIDVLLGADIYGQIIIAGLVKGPMGSPIAQNTHLGWILFGKIGETQKSSVTTSYHITSDPLESTLKKFWEIEEVSTTRLLTSEENACEDIFDTMHTRNKEGRFEVQLQFNVSIGSLGDSRNAAVQRLRQMERRFLRNPELKSQYAAFIDEFLKLNHMEKIPLDEVNKPCDEVYYLPHHAVIKNDRTTTKLRVVFDGSMASSSGISINNKLLVGRANDDIEDYRLLTVTYGMSSPSHSAIRSLRQLATNSINQHPIGTKIVLRDFYVDDLISGAEYVDSAFEIYIQLTQLLANGGFN